MQVHTHTHTLTEKYLAQLDCKNHAQFKRCEIYIEISFCLVSIYFLENPIKISLNQFSFKISSYTHIVNETKFKRCGNWLKLAKMDKSWKNKVGKAEKTSWAAFVRKHKRGGTCTLWHLASQMIGTEISFTPAVQNHTASFICVCLHSSEHRFIFTHLCERTWVEKKNEDMEYTRKVFIYYRKITVWEN